MVTVKWTAKNNSDWGREIVQRGSGEKKSTIRKNSTV